MASYHGLGNTCGGTCSGDFSNAWGLCRSRSEVPRVRPPRESIREAPAQTISAQYLSGLGGSDRCPLPRRALSQALVRPGFLVVLDELPEYGLQMAAPKDQQVVE